ncbi:Uncharacterised protein [Serratia fonticola]|uniref:Uncharacterized protein n=1 Tax=Serratia fonticola TaxID=47917 RepID=A0A4V6KT11_SERFO|nr:Uncharacterised protein [Serratia fonticola]
MAAIELAVAPSHHRRRFTAANPLSPLSRWKLFDNLRRSLVAPCFLLLLFFGLTWLPDTPYWLAVFAIILLLPTLLALLQDVVRKPPRRLLFSTCSWH